jgi:hypothetical protein
MAASYDPDPTQFLGIRLPVTFDTCEVLEERSCWSGGSFPPCWNVSPTSTVRTT